MTNCNEFSNDSSLVKTKNTDFNTSSDDSGVLMMAYDSVSSDYCGKFDNEEDDSITVKLSLINDDKRKKDNKSAICNGILVFCRFSKQRYSTKHYYSEDILHSGFKENGCSKSFYFSDSFLNKSKEKKEETTVYDNKMRNVEKSSNIDPYRKAKPSKKTVITDKMNKKSRRSKSQTKSFHLNYSNNISTLQRNTNSLNKRLSSSHNSLSDSNKADDSIFIKQAMSHDALDHKILDFYNVPLDSDTYATPVDFIRNNNVDDMVKKCDASSKYRHYSMQSTSSHVENKKNVNDILACTYKSAVKNAKTASIKKKTAKDSKKKSDRKSTFSINLKQKFCSIFRISQQHKHYRCSKKVTNDNSINLDESHSFASENHIKTEITMRKLPSLPSLPDLESTTLVDNVPNRNLKRKCVLTASSNMDFATNIEKVKEYGWYWGNTSSEGAEKILSNEPDGSFLVRDSSDSHYIFSLTFKLNGTVRHVRIDHDQGAFSFGSCAKFKSRTIMEFIENAVEHSRSGRYLFFLHRRPEYGPIRVQLTNPVSRFKHIQSLQHMCRFIIHKTIVRKDLIETLPLPRRILDYLSCHNCFEHTVSSDFCTK